MCTRATQVPPHVPLPCPPPAAHFYNEISMPLGTPGGPTPLGGHQEGEGGGAEAAPLLRLPGGGGVNAISSCDAGVPPPQGRCQGIHKRSTRVGNASSNSEKCAELGPELVEVGSGQSLVDACQCGPNLVEVGPKLTEPGPLLSDFGPNMTDPGAVWIDVHQFRTKFGRTRDKFDRLQATLGRVRSSPGEAGPILVSSLAG